MEQRKIEFTDILRSWLHLIHLAFHVIVALLLLFACSFILYSAVLTVTHPSRETILHLVNDALLSLIILELLWTVIRFLKKQKFILGPFLAIGIIAAIRRILLIEAQTSFMDHVPIENLYEIGLSAAVIIVLTVAYYISMKAAKLE